MKILIDTANLEEIRRAANAGLIDGVTTNPSLLAKVVGKRDLRGAGALGRKSRGELHLTLHWAPR